MMEPTANVNTTDINLLSDLIQQGQADKLKEFFQTTKMTSAQLLSWEINDQISSGEVHTNHKVHHEFRTSTLAGNNLPILTLMSANICDQQVMNDLVKYTLIESIRADKPDAVSAILGHPKLTPQALQIWLPNLLSAAYDGKNNSAVFAFLNHPKILEVALPKGITTPKGARALNIMKDANDNLMLVAIPENTNSTTTSTNNKITTPISISDFLLRAIHDHTLEAAHLPLTSANTYLPEKSVESSNEVASIKALLDIFAKKPEIPFYKVLQEKNVQGESVALRLDKHHRALVATHPRLSVILHLALYIEKSEKWWSTVHHKEFINSLMTENLSLDEMFSRADAYAKTKPIKPDGDFDQIKKMIEKGLAAHTVAVPVPQPAPSASSTSSTHVDAQPVTLVAESVSLTK